MPFEGNPKQPNRIYSTNPNSPRIGGKLSRFASGLTSGFGKGLVRGAGVVGKTLASSSGSSAGIFPKKSRVVSKEKASGPFHKANLSRKRIKVAEQAAKNAQMAYRNKSRYPNQISYEQLQELYPVWKKEMGERTAKEYMRAVGAPVGVAREHTEFRGGRRRMLRDVEKGLTGARNVDRENTPLAVMQVRGLSPGYEDPRHRGGVSREEFRQITEEMGKFYGPKVEERLLKEAGLEEAEGDKAKTPASQTRSSKLFGWKISSFKPNWGVKKGANAQTNTPKTSAPEQVDKGSIVVPSDAPGQRSSIATRENTGGSINNKPG